MSRYLCRYRRDTSGTLFEADEMLPAATYICGMRFDPTEALDVEQEKPPGALRPFPNADLPGTEDTGPVIAPEPTAPVPEKTFLEKFAAILDGIPNAPGFAPVDATECAWCRVTKKLAPWAGFVVVGLLVAWLSKKLFRR